MSEKRRKILDAAAWALAVLRNGDDRDDPIVAKLRAATDGTNDEVREILIEALAIIERHSGYRAGIEAFVTIFGLFGLSRGMMQILR
jgi:hypothetical protein